MKRFFWLLSVIICFQACNEQTEKPIVIDEVFDPTDEELYAACAELQGIGQFVIGKTTFKQVLADKDFKKVATSAYDRNSNMYNGHWGVDFWNKNGDNHVLPGDPKEKWMQEKTAPKLKQLPSTPYLGLTIGELKFSTFDMAFLNDTLVAIFFYPDDKIKDDVIAHYKEKYGNGRGKHYSYNLTQSDSNSRLSVTKVVDETHSWENDRVALVYENHEYFVMRPNTSSSGDFKHTLIIYSKKRYPVYEAILTGLSEQYDTIQAENKRNSLNAL